MCPGQKKPYKVFRAGGREFPVYLEYDEQLGESYPAYPDFGSTRSIPMKAGPLPRRSRRAALTASQSQRGSRRPAAAAVAAGFTGSGRPMTPSVFACAMRDGAIAKTIKEKTKNRK